MDFIGLDIGTSSIKAVELHREGRGLPRLQLYASSPVPPFQIMSENESDQKAFSKGLSDFISSFPFSTRGAVIALPESQIFTRVISLPSMSEKELKSAMQWEAEQYIPIPLTEVNLDWQILDGNDGKVGGDQVEVLLVAAPKNLISRYLKVLQQASIEVLGIETETIAVARSLVGEEASTPPTMVVNIGAATTDLTVVSRGSVRFTRSISTGGSALARAVSQSLGFDLDQAEEYKRTYGLDSSKLEGKVTTAIKPIFDVIVEEIKRSITFYASHHQGEAIKRAIISGGTAALPGIIVYLAEGLNVEVQLGNPWGFIDCPPKFSAKELEEIGPSFAVASGLALKDVN